MRNHEKKRLLETKKPLSYDTKWYLLLCVVVD